MSYDYESTLHFSLDVESGSSFKVGASLPVDGISWGLTTRNMSAAEDMMTKSYKKSYYEPKLFYDIKSTKAANNLSYSIQFKVKPNEYTYDHPFESLRYTIKCVDWFRSSTGLSSTNFLGVLRANNLKVEISAKLTIRATHNFLAESPHSLLKEISDPDLADFTIRIGTHKLTAHKFILSARSSVFRRMLANKDFEESKQSHMTIDDISKEIFELFLRFLYTDLIPNISLEQAAEVLKAAEKYDVQKLKKICDSMMVKLLQANSPANDIFQLAHAYNCSKELKDKAFQLMKATIFAGREMSDELAGEPQTVQKLVDKLNEFENMLAELNKAKKPKLQ